MTNDPLHDYCGHFGISVRSAIKSGRIAVVSRRNTRIRVGFRNAANRVRCRINRAGTWHCQIFVDTVQPSLNSSGIINSAGSWLSLSMA